MTDIGNWLLRATQLAWTLATLLVSGGLGPAIAAIAMARVPGWLSRHEQPSLRAVAHIVRRRVPWWCLLVARGWRPATGP